MWSLTLRAATSATAATTGRSSSMQRIFARVAAKLDRDALMKVRPPTGFSARASSTSSAAAKSTRPARYQRSKPHSKSPSSFRGGSKRRASATEHRAFFPTSAPSADTGIASSSSLPFRELDPATFAEDIETKKWKKLLKKSTTMVLADLDTKIQDRRVVLQKALASDGAYSSRDDRKAFSAELAAIANADANASERSKSRAARRNAAASRGRGSDPTIGAAVLDLYDKLVPQLILQIDVQQGTDRRYYSTCRALSPCRFLCT